MKPIFLLVSIMFLTVACSTDDNENISITYPPNNNLRLVRMDMGYTGPETPYQYLEYEYDANGYMVRTRSLNSNGTGEVAISNYEYVDGRVVNIAYSNGSNRSYTYQGDVIAGSIFGTTQWEYVYDSFGRLISIVRSQGGTEACTETQTYGATSQPIETLSECTQETQTFTYDNKKNPLYYLFHASFSRIAPLTPNNISGRTVTGPINNYTDTREFTYNNEGWPIEIRYLVDGNYVSSDRFYYE